MNPVSGIQGNAERMHMNHRAGLVRRCASYAAGPLMVPRHIGSRQCDILSRGQTAIAAPDLVFRAGDRKVSSGRMTAFFVSCADGGPLALSTFRDPDEHA